VDTRGGLRRHFDRPTYLCALADRAKFSAIDRQCVEHNEQADGTRVLTKRVEQDDVTVIFHHWIYGGTSLDDAIQARDPAIETR
jgi:hypothetical protein